MLHFAKRKPRKCPVCGESPVASILWGMPNFTPELEEKLEKGTWTIGGCCQPMPSPLWRCNKCEIDIYRERDKFFVEEGGHEEG